MFAKQTNSCLDFKFKVVYNWDVNLEQFLFVTEYSWAIIFL